MISRQVSFTRFFICYNKNIKMRGGDNIKKARIIMAIVSALAAVFAFAASAFAEAPCVGPFYEPEMPEKLKKR
ncbi:MAG: cyclic lactone autoinducer peptide [Clostridia bacterium]|nr:cyclic lactone autoinducer peptide [Clostridia bacterium]